jgi:hypothetical protein
VFAQLMHEASTFAIGSGRKRCGGDNRACIEQNIGGDGGKARAFVGEGGRVSNEDRNVIIGIRFRLAARASRTAQRAQCGRRKSALRQRGSGSRPCHSDASKQVFYSSSVVARL